MDRCFGISGLWIMIHYGCLVAGFNNVWCSTMFGMIYIYIDIYIYYNDLLYIYIILCILHVDGLKFKTVWNHQPDEWMWNDDWLVVVVTPTYLLYTHHEAIGTQKIDIRTSDITIDIPLWVNVCNIHSSFDIHWPLILRRNPPFRQDIQQLRPQQTLHPGVESPKPNAGTGPKMGGFHQET